MSWRHVIAAGAAVLLLGCYHPGIQPRTGEIAEPYETVRAGFLTPTTFAPAHIDTPSGEQFEGNFGERRKYGLLPELVASALMFSELHFAVGLPGRLELGTSLGLHQAELGFRIGVLGENWGHDLSMALSGAARYRLLPRGSGARAGIDLSKRMGYVTSLLDIHYTRSPEAYSYDLPSSAQDRCMPPDAGLPLAGCYISIERTESRLAGAVGARFPVRDMLITLALMPYLVVDAEPATAICSWCGDVAAESFVSDWGMSLVLGIRASN